MADLIRDFSQHFSERKIIDKASVENSEAFCMLPWVHLFITQLGTVGPCCVASWEEDDTFGNVNKEPIKDIWNGPRMREMRSNMIQDKKDKRCWQCYENDKIGIRSHRKIYNKQYIHKLEWVLSTLENGMAPDSKPIYWDIRISNLCNFKCRICGHHSSSKWYDEAVKLNETSYDKAIDYSIEDLDDLLEQLAVFLPYVEEITFAGGEPIIMKEHYQLLDFLKEHDCTDIQLRYLTNFSDTKLQKRDIFEEWKIFKNVSIHASLDGTYARGEYQRKGQKWDQVLNNRKRMMEEVPHVEFYLSPTISVFNIFHIPDFHKEWVESGLVQLQRFLPDSLKNPNEYSMKILPLHMKKQIEVKYREHIKWIESFGVMDELMELVLQEFNRTIDFMYSEDWSHLIPNFIQKSNILDKFRDENTLEVFPELIEMYMHAISSHPNNNITLL